MITRGKPPEVLAYTAGIIDGEGHIGLDKTYHSIQRRLSPRYQIHVTVINSCKPLLDWLQAHYGGSINARKVPHEHYKPQWRWKLSSRAAVELCEALLPYLLVKKGQAEQVILYQTLVREPGWGRGRGQHLSDDEVAKREEVYQELKRLTGRTYAGMQPQRLSERAPDVE